LQSFVGDGVSPVLRRKIKIQLSWRASAFAIKKSPGKGEPGALVERG